MGTDSGQVGNPNTLWHTAEITDGKGEAAQGMMQRKGGDCIPGNPDRAAADRCLLVGSDWEQTGFPIDGRRVFNMHPTEIYPIGTIERPCLWSRDHSESGPAEKMPTPYHLYGHSGRPGRVRVKS